MGNLADLLLEESDFVPKYQIYCDMDGVLTDFEKRFVTLLRKEGPKYYSKATIAQVTRPKHFDKLEGTEEFWKFIDQYIGLEFWSEMEWMPNGRELWNFIQPYGPKLLTSPSRDNTSRLGKRLWVKENLVPAPEVLFRFGDAKSDFANENAILIDDKPSNLAAFSAKGGIAIEVKEIGRASCRERVFESV
jgi:hypothetical protein